MDYNIKFVIFLSHDIYIFKFKITWGLNCHMAAAICMEASMLLSQDEACKFLVRSEMISYHSVNGNSFFFQQFCPKKGWKGITLTTSLYNLSQKSCFFSGGKKIGYVNVAFNFGHVWPCLVILGMILMINVAHLSAMFPLSRLKYCFLCLQGNFKLSSW